MQRAQATREGGTFALLKSWHFPSIEKIHNFAPNVSSQRSRRNNSHAQETIFRFWSRHPETQAH
jgi:hypothetical protein